MAHNRPLSMKVVSRACAGAPDCVTPYAPTSCKIYRTGYIRRNASIVKGRQTRMIRGLPELYGAPRASASAEESTRMADFCSTEARIRMSTGKSASRQLSVHYERPSMSFVTPSVRDLSARTFRSLEVLWGRHAVTLASTRVGWVHSGATVRPI